MNQLKHPLQALLIAPEHAMRSNVVHGRKKITIREGSRDYRTGPVMLCCEKVPWCVAADIVSVRHCKLSEVTEEEYVADGFESANDMLAQMKRFYPKLTLDSDLTVIRWENVRGMFVDNAEDFSLDPESVYERIGCD